MKEDITFYGMKQSQKDNAKMSQFEAEENQKQAKKEHAQRKKRMQDFYLQGYIITKAVGVNKGKSKK